jgi:hypothetical protein
MRAATAPAEPHPSSSKIKGRGAPCAAAFLFG